MRCKKCKNPFVAIHDKTNNVYYCMACWHDVMLWDSVEWDFYFEPKKDVKK